MPSGGGKPFFRIGGYGFSIGCVLVAAGSVGAWVKSYLEVRDARVRGEVMAEVKYDALIKRNENLESMIGIEE